MSGLSGVSLAAIALAALWIAVAVMLSVVAARRLSRAAAVQASARPLASLLEVAPARPLLVRPDGRIEADARLLRDLGLDQAPARLADLAGDNAGIEKEDLDALIADVEAAAIA